jgi:DNA repair exonuclease SbcCD ATPase subunit
MLKKILIAAVAVVAGLAVLNLSLVKVWWKDCCHTTSRLVPPEVRLKQLNGEIENIDKDIRKNISNLARMEVQTEKLAKQLEEWRGQKDKLGANMEQMEQALEGRTEKVSFHGRSYRKSQLAEKLESSTSEFKLVSDQIKEQDKLVQEKKRTLETSLARLEKMRHQRNKLRVLSVRLSNELERLKIKQMETRVGDIDDSALTRCQQIADDIETYLREKENETRHLKEFGYETPESAFDKEPKSIDEVLKASRQARQEKDEVSVAIEPQGKE